MKRTIIIVVIAIVIVSAFFALFNIGGVKEANNNTAAGEEVETVDYEKSISDFITFTKQGNIKSVAKYINYPLTRPYPLKNITNQKEFVARYAELFDKQIIDMVEASQNKWQKMGWRGVMLNNGDIWFDFDGKISAINYKTALSKELLLKSIENEYSKVHHSVKQAAKAPIFSFRTSDNKWIGRIDKTDDKSESNSVQLALYKQGSSLSDKPDYLLNGELNIEGSDANAYYYFQGTDVSFMFSDLQTYEEGNHPVNLHIKRGECDIKSESNFNESLNASFIYWQDI